MFTKMRCLYVFIVAAEVTVSTALMIRDLLDDALAANGEPPYPVTTSPIEGTWCNVAAVKVWRWFPILQANLYE